MSAAIKLIQDNVFSSDDFVNYTSTILKQKFGVKYINIGGYAKDSYLVGEDLLSIYFAYTMQDESYLPAKITLHHAQAENKNRNLVNNRCNHQFFGEDPATEFISNNGINCYQAIYNIFSGVTFGSASFDEFLTTKEVEITHQSLNKDPLIEIMSAFRFIGIYINVDREMSVFNTGVKLYDFSSMDKIEAKQLKFFFARLVVTHRSKSISKVNQIIKFQNIFRLLAIKTGFSVNLFDTELKKMPETNKLRYLEEILEQDYIKQYFVYSDLPLNLLIDDLAELKPYIKNYGKAMKEIYRYFQENNLGRITKAKVEKLIKDPESRKDLGSFFDLPNQPLKIDEFKEKHPSFEINEIISTFDLKKEGTEMNHCLGSDEFYEYEENTLNARYFAIKSEEGRSTLKLYCNLGKWQILEHKARFNETPNLSHRGLADELASFLNDRKIKSVSQS